MKNLTVRQIAQLKRTAQNVYPLVVKKNKLYAQLAELSTELESVNAQIDAWEGATKAMTGGYTSEDLIVRTVSIATNEDGSNKIDKNGQPVKVTKYEPNSSILIYNEESSVYEIVEVVNELDSTPNVDGEAQAEMVETDNALNNIGINTDIEL